MNNLAKKVFFYLFLLAVIFQSCKKDEIKPILTTDPVFCIARTCAVCKGEIIFTGPDSIIDYGFCWSTGGAPTLSNNSIASQNMNDSVYSRTITGLNTNTLYYVRSYLTSTSGTNYGNQVSFKTKPATAHTFFNPDLTYQVISDIDGNSYKTIQIGTQEWMAENLKTSRLNDGTAIPMITDALEWQSLNTPGYSWYENNESVFKNIYGAYYNWYVVNTGKLCPTGWHVPDEDDWKVLKISLGMTPEQATMGGFQGTTEGSKIKEAGTFNWVEGSSEATNESGFTALPGSCRLEDGSFPGEGQGAGWWSATVIWNPYSWSHWVVWNKSWVHKSDMLGQEYGLNVRCIKN